jgi:type II secretory pathway component PulJ
MYTDCEEDAMSRHPSQRRGYALLLVMACVILFTAVLGVAWRRVASALRIEHVCEIRRQCDEGSIQVLAKAVQVLETRLRRNSTTSARIDGVDSLAITYRYQSDSLPNPSQWYTITFTRTNSDGTQWAVSVATSASDPGGTDLPSNPP